jgi:hypothetical protein
MPEVGYAIYIVWIPSDRQLPIEALDYAGVGLFIWRLTGGLAYALKLVLEPFE